MKAYIDTSILTGVYCGEPASNRAQKVLRDYEPVVSSLTRLEFSSSVSKKLRVGDLAQVEATRIISFFHEHLRERMFALVAIRESHYALANEWLDSLSTPLRTMDALHLAVAAANDLPVVTADSTMAKAGRALGLEVLRS